MMMMMTSTSICREIKLSAVALLSLTLWSLHPNSVHSFVSTSHAARNVCTVEGGMLGLEFPQRKINRSQTTRCYALFDWLNPNPPKEETSVEDKVNGEDETQSVKRHSHQPSKTGWEWILDSLQNQQHPTATTTVKPTEGTTHVVKERPSPPSIQSDEAEDDKTTESSVQDLDVPTLEEIAETVQAEVASLTKQDVVTEAPEQVTKQVEKDPEFDGDFFLGRVKWFNPKKGYGFLEPVYSPRTTKMNASLKDMTQQEFFVHQTKISTPDDGNYFRNLLEKEIVHFRLEDDGKGGLRASHVRGGKDPSHYVKSVYKQQLQKFEDGEDGVTGSK